MVATDEELGSEAGVEILKRGGNAVDAAVAVAFALAVVEPAAGNIGGGGFMLIRLASGKTTFLDYREVAPGKATRDMYIGKDGKLDEEASVIGYRSIAVPGTVAGLALALKSYGSMKLADVMAPAIRRTRHRRRPRPRAEILWLHEARRRHGSGDSPCRKWLTGQQKARA